MKDFTAQNPAREMAVLWTKHGNEARQVQGFSCAPSNPEYWWCPEIGLSISEKHHVYPDERSAWSAAKVDIEAQIKVLQVHLERAEHHLAELT